MSGKSTHGLTLIEADPLLDSAMSSPVYHNQFSTDWTNELAKSLAVNLEVIFFLMTLSIREWWKESERAHWHNSCVGNLLRLKSGVKFWKRYCVLLGRTSSSSGLCKCDECVDWGPTLGTGRGTKKSKAHLRRLIMLYEQYTLYCNFFSQAITKSRSLHTPDG
jgi:hypothetical protein